MNSNQRSIIICTTSNIPFDRRMKRIASELDNASYKLCWIGMNRTEADIDLAFKVLILDCFFNKGFLFYAEYNLRLFFKLIAHRKHFDIINAVDLDTILPSYLVSKLFKKKLVFDAHEYFEEVPELSNRNFVQKVWSAIGKICLNGNTYNYTVNETLSDIFSKKYHSQFSVIRNLPLLNDNKDVPVRTEKILVYLGVLNKGRGVRQAIESLQELKDYSLWLMGEGDLVEEFKGLVDKLELAPRVKFLGWVEPCDINKHLAKARIGINLLDGTSESYRLSLANKFFDYIQIQLPSINMAYPEYQKIIEQHEVGLMITELSTSQFIGAVRSLENEILYSKLQSNCREAAKIYNWEIEAKNLLSFYSKL